MRIEDKIRDQKIQYEINRKLQKYQLPLNINIPL